MIVGLQLSAEVVGCEPKHGMNEDPTKELPGLNAFENRVLNELAAIRVEQSAMRDEQSAMARQQTAMTSNIGSLDNRLTAVEKRLDSVEKRLDSVEARLDSMDTRLGLVEARLGSLEEKVDKRLQETRPIWEAVQVSIQRLDMKFDDVVHELIEIRTDVRLHDKLFREFERERRPSQ
jgi:chromosome segregation ATPase